MAFAAVPMTMVLPWNLRMWGRGLGRISAWSRGVMAGQQFRSWWCAVKDAGEIVPYQVPPKRVGAAFAAKVLSGPWPGNEYGIVAHGPQGAG